MERKIQLDIFQVISQLELDEQRWHQLQSESERETDNQNEQSQYHASITSTAATFDT